MYTCLFTLSIFVGLAETRVIRPLSYRLSKVKLLISRWQDVKLVRIYTATDSKFEDDQPCSNEKDAGAQPK